MTTALVSVPTTDIRAMAESACKSGLFPALKSPDAVMTLMLLCQAEGLHPITALRRYHIIQGTPALRTDAMLGDFQARGGKVTWIEHTPTAVEGEFMSPGLGAPVKVRWTMEDAKRAGLDNKDNWRKFPRQMLRARVISEGIRMAMPEVVAGVYSPEEVQDFERPAAAQYTPPAAHPANDATPPHDPATGEVKPPASPPVDLETKRRRAKAMQRELGISDTAWKAGLVKRFGKESSTALDEAEMDRLISDLVEAKRAAASDPQEA